ncbi:MAG TPA: hypothetical protein VGN17_26135 [Bryobacteraceae bacterium]|jgi:hypothetical protein
MPSNTLVFADSFQFYDPRTQANQLYTTADLQAGTGNNVIAGSTLLPGSVHGSLKFGLPDEVTELTVGIRWQTQNLSHAPITFTNDYSGFGFSVVPVGDGRFTFSAGLAGSATAGIVTQKSIRNWTWYYFELHLQTVRQYQPHIPATPTTPEIFEQYWLTCFYDFYVNGEAWVVGGVLDSPHRRTDGDGNVGANPWLDHLSIKNVLLDATTGIMTDFYVTANDSTPLGDVEIVPLYPNGDGDSQWTPISGSTHYVEVNNHPPDGTTYNVADAAGQEDSYDLQDLPAFSGTVKGTVAIWYVTLSDAGAGAAFGYYNVDSKATGLFYPSYGSWQFIYDAWRVFPFTTTEWTQTQVNSLRLGIARFS